MLQPHIYIHISISMCHKIHVTVHHGGLMLDLYVTVHHGG